MTFWPDDEIGVTSKAEHIGSRSTPKVCLVPDTLVSCRRSSSIPSKQASGLANRTDREFTRSEAMHVFINGVRLFFDVEGAKLVPDGPAMREKPTLLLLHGGPGFDHSIYKPAYSALADAAHVP